MLKSAIALVYNDVFDEDAIRLIRSYTLENKDNFNKATVIGDVPNYREAWVTGVRDNVIVEIILEKVKSLIPEVLSALGFDRFDLTMEEIQLTRHGNGGFYKVHTDNSDKTLQDRMLTYVFYFNLGESNFTGGDLVLYDHYDNEDGRFLANSSFLKIEPIHNRLVIFLSSSFHEVSEVYLEEDKFEYGRFTINGWLRGKLTPEESPVCCICNTQKL